MNTIYKLKYSNRYYMLLLLVFLFSFNTYTAFSQDYGLTFNGQNYSLDERTGLNLTPNEFVSFNNEFDIQVVEYNDHSGGVFVVQKNQIGDLVTLHTLYEDKGNSFIKIIDDIKPDIIHFTEIPEHFIDHSILDKIFGNKNRMCLSQAVMSPYCFSYRTDSTMMVL